jgi:hypothetical protein
VLCRTAELPPWFTPEIDTDTWVDLELLDRLMQSSLDRENKQWTLMVTALFDAALHIDRARSPRFVPTRLLDTNRLIVDVLVDPALHLHAESASFFAPLSSVKIPIVQTLTKHGIKMRCQGRSAMGMAMKRIVTRSLEQQGKIKKRVYNANRYQGYVLKSIKSLMLCSLLGNYSHVQHSMRPRARDVRQKLYQIFTEPRYERWVVKLIHQSIDVLTVCIREFMAYTITQNRALHDEVADLMRLPEYASVTQRWMNEVRAYMTRYLTSQSDYHVYGDPALDQSDLFYSFNSLPANPCSLQRFYVCGRTDCGLPCPHKFMKAKEVKTSASAMGEEDETLHSLIEEMSSDRFIVIHHRKDEVEREKCEAIDEQNSGWKWTPDVFHAHLNTLMSCMEQESSKLSYSRPWKLDMLFGARRESRESLSKEDHALLKHVVTRCRPVGCGDPMPTIVRFFRWFGVEPRVVGMLLDLLKPSVRLQSTENSLKMVMDGLESHEPRASLLFRTAWQLVCEMQEHFSLHDLPVHIARNQLIANREVYHGHTLPVTMCFVFCAACETVYSHIVDGTVTVHRKMFRYGLNKAEIDQYTMDAYCTHKDTSTRSTCRERLVFIPLAGRAIRWKRRVIALCCQPRCGRLMYLDRRGEKSYTMWNHHGFACHVCMTESRVSAVHRYSDLEFLFSTDAAPQQCAIESNHESDRVNRRFKDNQLHILSPYVYCCKKCWLPSMAGLAKECREPVKLKEQMENLLYQHWKQNSERRRQTAKARSRSLIRRAARPGR